MFIGLSVATLLIPVEGCKPRRCLLCEAVYLGCNAIDLCRGIETSYPALSAAIAASVATRGIPAEGLIQHRRFVYCHSHLRLQRPNPCRGIETDRTRFRKRTCSRRNAPHPCTGLWPGGGFAIQRNYASAALPGLNLLQEVAPQSAQQTGEGRGERDQPALPGASTGKTASFVQLRPQSLEQLALSFHKGQQAISRVQPSDDHDHEGFEREVVRIHRATGF